MYKPIQLTDEEIDELLREIKLDDTSSCYSTSYGNYWDDYDYWDNSDDAKTSSGKCAHEWVPSLLLTTTVYDCAKCGMKKEDCDEEK